MAWRKRTIFTTAHAGEKEEGSRNGDYAGREIRLIAMDSDPRFEWCDPPVAHFRWDEQAVVRRVVRWVGSVAQGKEDRRQYVTPAKFIGGETLPRVGDA